MFYGVIIIKILKQNYVLKCLFDIDLYKIGNFSSLLQCMCLFKYPIMPVLYSILNYVMLNLFISEFLYECKKTL